MLTIMIKAHHHQGDVDEIFFKDFKPMLKDNVQNPPFKMMLNNMFNT